MNFVRPEQSHSSDSWVLTGVDIGDLACAAPQLSGHLGGHTQRVADLRLTRPAYRMCRPLADSIYFNTSRIKCVMK